MWIVNNTGSVFIPMNSSHDGESRSREDRKEHMGMLKVMTNRLSAVLWFQAHLTTGYKYRPALHDSRTAEGKHWKIMLLTCIMKNCLIFPYVTESLAFILVKKKKTRSKIYRRKAAPFASRTPWCLSRRWMFTIAMDRREHHNSIIYINFLLLLYFSLSASI